MSIIELVPIFFRSIFLELKNLSEDEYDVIRRAIVYFFFTSLPPSRSQNLKLLVSEGNLCDQDAQNLVAKFNKDITADNLKQLSRTKVSGVIFKVCFWVIAIFYNSY